MSTRQISKFKKTFIVLGVVFLLLVFFSSNAFSWGPATHAYIADHLGEKWGLKNKNEMYGAMAPDVCYMFDNLYLSYFCFQTHSYYQIKKVLEASMLDPSRWDMKKSLAYGFVSHNNDWGADHTAHNESRTLSPDEGYVVTIAKLLNSEFPLFGLPEGLAHKIVEGAGDVLVKGLDPSIGWKISSSALFRSTEFQTLLVTAYANDFSTTAGISYSEAEEIIKSADTKFRVATYFYGLLLTQDKKNAVRSLSIQMAYDLLSAYEIKLPLRTLASRIEYAMYKSMAICEEYDYDREISETIEFIRDGLNGIPY